MQVASMHFKARAHDNLLVVPHLGGNTVESFDKTERFLADRVAAALAAPEPLA